jgi:SNF2 family DNA or RNA helicase
MIDLYSFAMLQKARTARRMLVVAPLRVCWAVWPDEAKKWEQTQHLKVVVLHGPKKEQLLDSDADVFCINYEGLPWLLKQGRLARLDADLLTMDEIHKLKHSDTARFKMLKPFLPHFTRRWGLTGTPAPNGLMDIFGQMYCLDLGDALGAYITAFRNKYFDATGFGDYQWVLKPDDKGSTKKTERRIYKKIRPLVLRIGNEVLGDALPKLVFNDIKIEMTKGARRVYNEMEHKLITMLKDGTRVNAVNTAVAAGKCLQICNGQVYVENEETWKRESKLVHKAKLDALKDLVEEIGGKPTLLLYSYDHDRKLIRKAFPNAPQVADYSGKKSRMLFDRWNRGEIPLMVAQPQSIGHGLNLQGGGQHIIWFGVPWDLTIWLQAIDRLRRQGSPFEHIFVHCLLMDKTIDTKVRGVLKGKDRTQGALLRAMLAPYR